MRSVEHNIRNDPAAIAEVREALDRLGGAHAIPDRVLAALQVAHDEIVSNVIRYVWPAGGLHDVQVRLAVTDTGVDMTVTDDGLACDAHQAPTPAPVAPGQRQRLNTSPLWVRERHGPAGAKRQILSAGITYR